MNQASPIIRKCCSTCKSENIKLDAWASWNTETQDWKLDNVFDDAYCEDCEGPCSIEDAQFEERPYQVTINLDSPMSYGESFATLDAALEYATKEFKDFEERTPHGDQPEVDGATCEHDTTGELWKLSRDDQGALCWVTA